MITYGDNTKWLTTANDFYPIKQKEDFMFVALRGSEAQDHVAIQKCLSEFAHLFFVKCIIQAGQVN